VKALGRLWRRVPPPLALLLVVVAVFGAMWVLIVPAWGAPDEDAHFAYTASLADLGRLPGGEGNAVSREQRQSMDYTNTDATTFFPYAKPEWSAVAEREWRANSRSADRRDGGGVGAASSYPPAYYLFATIPYKIAGKSDVLTRVYTVRAASLLWLLVATTAAWLLAGEVFGRRRPLQLVTAATVALWALSTWLGASLALRGPSLWRAVALAFCVGLAVVTKTTALALIPPALIALAFAAWPLRRRIPVRRVVAVAGVAVAFLIPVGTWYAVANHSGRPAWEQTQVVSGNTKPEEGKVARTSSPRLFASYMWQYYLPRLPFMTKARNIFPVISSYPAAQVWLGSGWAVFGWVNVWFPNWVYYIFLGVVILIAAGLLATARGRQARRRDPSRRITLANPRVRLAVFVTAMVGLLWAGLHWTDYKLYINQEAPFLQGRYLLPVAPLLALLVAQATRALPKRWRTAGQGAILGGLIVFQVACLGLVAARYYA
jgi:4-amino-4-deoxy-L-arabinose transferase-like glycosyltransferase